MVGSVRVVVRRIGSLGAVAAVLAACLGDDPTSTGSGSADGGATSSSSGALDGAVGSGDGGGSESGSPSTCWSFSPDHYDPCAADFDAKYPSAAAKTVDGATTFDTDTADTLAFGGGLYGVYRFRSFTVTATGTLTVKGTTPALIIVDEDVTIDGKIIVQPTTAVPDLCKSAALDSESRATNCTDGGSGGGYGAEGGKGGGNANVAAANGNAKLTPLRPGCRGGKSGEPKPVSNNSMSGASSAPGGLGGGALGISARGKVIVSQTASVVANGTGGGAGDAHKGKTDQCQTGDSQSCDSGGGGGGSGGAILIEGASVTIMGQVCAVGGGGGSGGAENGVVGAGGATSTSCAVASGAATPSASAGGAGGAVAPAGNGAAGSCGFTSAGGGGGSVGRIRIRAKGTPNISGLVTPLAFTE